MNHWSIVLNDNGLEAPEEIRTWARAQPTAEAAWASCERGDWLLWVAYRINLNRKLVTLATCACVRLALPHVRQGDMRPLHAIETAEAWARGRYISKREWLSVDADIAKAVAECPDLTAADFATRAARAAIEAPRDISPAHAAECVAYAFYEASFEKVGPSAAATAQAEAFRKCADIVRQTLSDQLQ